MEDWSLIESLNIVLNDEKYEACYKYSILFSYAKM